MFITDNTLFPEQTKTQNKLRHGFFGKQGGASYGVYGSLNCALGSDDDDDKVIENRNRVSAYMGFNPEQLLTTRQVHGTDCEIVTMPWGDDKRPEVDAMVTKQKGLLLGILTADCAPVLFHGQDQKNGDDIIGIAHAGWRGAQAGVLENTIAAMETLGAARSEVTASIGPCIGLPSYEVSNKFFGDFLADDKDNYLFFVDIGTPDKKLFDLGQYIKSRLKKIGVGQVSYKNIDTYFNEEDYFSYRRSTHREEVDCGRHISVIGLV